MLLHSITFYVEAAKLARNGYENLLILLIKNKVWAQRSIFDLRAWLKGS